jgi:hypothetical protein
MLGCYTIFIDTITHQRNLYVHNEALHYQQFTLIETSKTSSNLLEQITLPLYEKLHEQKERKKQHKMLSKEHLNRNSFDLQFEQVSFILRSKQQKAKIQLH